MLVVPTPDLPERHHIPPVVVIVVKIFIFALVLTFAMLVLHAGVQVVAAGTFVSLAVLAAVKAGGQMAVIQLDPPAGE